MLGWTEMTDRRRTAGGGSRWWGKNPLLILVVERGKRKEAWERRRVVGVVQIKLGGEGSHAQRGWWLARRGRCPRTVVALHPGRKEEGPTNCVERVRARRRKKGIGPKEERGKGQGERGVGPPDREIHGGVRVWF